MKRRAAEIETTGEIAAARPGEVPSPSRDTTGHSALSQRRAGPHSFEDAEVRYVAARDAWTKAMRTASSGRPADLASLALAQETYEAAAAERERWLSGGRTATPDTDTPHMGIDAVVGQEIEWQRVRHLRAEGLLGRLKRRLTGR